MLYNQYSSSIQTILSVPELNRFNPFYRSRGLHRRSGISPCPEECDAKCDFYCYRGTNVYIFYLCKSKQYEFVIQVQKTSLENNQSGTYFNENLK